MPDLQKYVWLIEARNWAADDPRKTVPLDPVNSGSGVVVKVEPIDEQGRPKTDPKTGNRLARNYLLTCAHVVRHPATGPVVRELVCFESGKGYFRTEPGAREKGEHPGSLMAQVSKLSPCPHEINSVPAELSGLEHDWVLLEMIPAPDFLAFQQVPAALDWATAETSKGKPLSIIGYPEGAGARANEHTPGAKYWKTGDIVVPTSVNEFELSDCTHGLLNYQGNGEPRPGMSGGGVFDSSGQLLGIHQLRSDPSLRNGAIALEHIDQWLRLHRQMALVTQPAPVKPGKILPWLKFAATALAILLLFVASALVQRLLSPGYHFLGSVVEHTDGRDMERLLPLEGVSVTPIMNGRVFGELKHQTDRNGTFDIVTKDKAFKFNDVTLRMEKPGFQTREFTERSARPLNDIQPFVFRLHKTNAPPPSLSP